MQNLFHKLFLLFSIFWIGGAQLAHCQTNNIDKGDALFKKKLYAQAKKYYLLEWEQNKSYSPRMLLRLGFIEEQEKNIPMALYYYNQFHDLTYNTDIITKIQELADEQHLQGYEFSDIDYFISIYRRFYYPIVYSIILLGFIYFSYLVIRAIQKKPWGSRPIGFLAIMALVFLINNYDIIPNSAIITNQTCLMSSPAAGADCSEIIQEGSKVIIINTEEEVWYRVLWNNQTFFIRDKHLKIIKSEIL